MTVRNSEDPHSREELWKAISATQLEVGELKSSVSAIANSQNTVMRLIEGLSVKIDNYVSTDQQSRRPQYGLFVGVIISIAALVISFTVMITQPLRDTDAEFKVAIREMVTDRNAAIDRLTALGVEHMGDTSAIRELNGKQNADLNNLDNRMKQAQDDLNTLETKYEELMAEFYTLKGLSSACVSAR